MGRGRRGAERMQEVSCRVVEFTSSTNHFFKPVIWGRRTAIVQDND
jgi:hypothetical protein